MSEASTRPYSLNCIYFYLTEGCNLRCRHCWIQPKYQTEEHTFPALDLGLFQSILEQAEPLGLSSVKLSGGEPLLHPQIIEILDQIRQADLRLIVETNGVFCTPELTQELATCQRPFVSVSLDGSEAETHEWVRGVEGCFAASLEGIRNLVNVGLPPQVIMTIMRRNKHQMESVVRLAESLGAESVKFNVLQPTARGEKMHEAGEALSIEELSALGQWSETSLPASTSLRIHYSHPLAFRPLGRMFGENGDGCSTCGVLGILGVLADGSYALCGIGETVPELIFGHASRDRLVDIWNDNPTLKELRCGLPNRLGGICSECLVRDRCLGSCVAQNFYRSGSLWAGYWYCEEAHRRGLFPESRLSIDGGGRYLEKETEV